MTQSFTRTQQEGETWVWLTPTRLLITHVERQPLVIDTDGNITPHAAWLHSMGLDAGAQRHAA